MDLNTIRGQLAPAINAVTTLPADIKAQAKDIQSDLSSASKTTAGKVHNLISLMMDSASLVEITAATTFIFAGAFYIKSYVSTFAAIFSPISSVTTLVAGVLIYDSYQTYHAVKGLHEWMIQKHSDHEEEMSFDEEAVRQWTTFTTTMKYKTWIAEPLLRPFLEQATAAIKA